jgi:hypothetical protein
VKVPGNLLPGMGEMRRPVPEGRSWKSRGFGDEDKRGVKGLLMSKNAEGDVKEFAHNGAADGKIMEFAAFEQSDPRPQGKV